MVMVDLIPAPTLARTGPPLRRHITRRCPACDHRELTVRAPGDPKAATTIWLTCPPCPVEGEFIRYTDQHGKDLEHG